MDKIKIIISTLFLWMNLGALARAQAPIDSNRLFMQLKGRWHLPLSHFKKVKTYEHREKLFYDEARPNISFLTDSTTSVVHAVCGGRVQGIFGVGDTYAIMIKYGSFYVTYCGLNKPELQKGDLVSEGQVISTLYTDSNTQDGELEIVLSDMNFRYYDPQKWFNWKSRRMNLNKANNQ